jgi:hypothetical protein
MPGSRQPFGGRQRRNKCVAFIKVECFDINSNRLLIVENENNPIIMVSR